MSSNTSTNTCKSFQSSLTASPKPFRSKLVVLNPENTFRSFGRCGHVLTCKRGKNAFFTGFVDNKERGIQVSDKSTRISKKCCIASFIVILLLVLCIVSGVCFGLKMVESLLRKAESPSEKSFKGLFHVFGEVFNQSLTDSSSQLFTFKSNFYENQLNTLLEKSVLKTAFIKSEVIAFDQLFNSTFGIIVHFNLYLNARKADIDSGHIYLVMQEKLEAQQNRLFSSSIKIDPQSLEIRERSVDTAVSLQSKTTTENSTNNFHPFTEPDTIFSRSDISSNLHKQCVPVASHFCSNVYYNQTSFPNMFGHTTRYEVDEFVEKHFTKLIASNCYHHLKYFLCSLLQPSCSSHEVVQPCKEFCHTFLSRCHSLIPFSLSRHLQCNSFPSVTNPAEKCIMEPDCSAFLRARNRNDWICDDISDCRDFSDENKCNRCKPGHFYCGGNVCISSDKQCDKHVDCPNGLDEMHCTFILKSLPLNSVPVHSSASGILVVRQHGIAAKVCVDNLNYTALGNKKYVLLNTIARTACEHLNYKKMKFVRIITDYDVSKMYYHISTDTTSITNTSMFIKTQCQSHSIISLGCSSFVCGRRIFSGNATITRNKVGPAAWPWHASIIRDDIHVCDGTLVSDQWLLTSEACFQGQPKSHWKIRIGSSRLLTISPNEQQRPVSSVLRSPVEGSTILAVRLNSPVNFTATVRPACIASKGQSSYEGRRCVVLSWDRKGEQLFEIPVLIVNNKECDIAAQTTPNTLCAVPTYTETICENEELAGSGLLCQDGDAWTLTGVLNWRVGCGLARRPLLFDKISSSSQWLNRVITN